MTSPPSVRSPGSSSLSSYDYFSHSRSASQDASSGESDGSYGTVSDDVSSDDEIVLSFSDISSLEIVSQRGDVPPTPGVFSDDEFVIMSRPRTPREDDLVAAFSALAVAASGARSRASSSSKSSSPSKASRRRVKKKRSAAPAPGNGTSVATASSSKASEASLKTQTPSKARRKAKRAALREAIAPSASGFGDRPIVDDVSEAGSEYPAVYVPPSVYESAQTYVSSVLSADPSKKAGIPKLAFLQALIIELGLYPALQPDDSPAPVAPPASFFSLPSLPSSLRAAKALLKSQVFLNVRDYLAVRSEGVDALRRVMHPSRSALLRDIRSGRKAPVKSVKESGLSVLLVTCYR